MKRAAARVAWIAATLVACSASLALGESAYPNKPVRLLIPVPPGGGTDFLGRLLGQKLTDIFGEAFVIDNRGGASGAIAALAVARGVPDGYTLLFGYTAPLGINPVLTKVGYDPVADFAQISFVATTPNVLVVHPAVPVKSVQELIDYAKSRPGQLRYASAGTGSAPHMSGEMFNYMTGTKMIHVPYKGIGPALIDVLGGHLELSFASLPSVLPHGKAGRLRMLAVTGLKRSTQLPELPTISESGLKGFNTDQWYGVLAPAKTPPALVARLNKEVVAAVKSPDFTARAQAQGFEVLGTSGAEFREHIRSEIAKWSKLVKAVGIKVE
jgi:tripartite-type tricarboxylate transporter receptor subunit TctC